MNVLTIPDAHGIHVFTGRDEIIAQLLEDVVVDELDLGEDDFAAECPGHPYWEREITSGSVILPEDERALLM